MIAVATPPLQTVVGPDDLFDLPDGGKGYELANGALEELAVSKQSSYTAGTIHFALSDFCRTRQPAWVFPEGTSFRCFADDPGRVRRPDTSVITLDRMPPAAYRDEGHCTTVPDLVVEVISPTDTARRVRDKLAEWRAAGVRVLWEVYPTSQTVRVHRPGEPIIELGPADTLTAADVLPGFAVPVADLFRLPGEPAPV